MRIYIDTSALVKRVFDEPESDAVDEVLQRAMDGGDAVVTSTLAWIEVSRAVQRRRSRTPPARVEVISEHAMSGVLDRPIGPEVIGIARRLAPAVLRSLDAIHLATALVLDVDVILGFDRRLTNAARQYGIRPLRVPA
ncbi:MAG: type II toxin-antitoxin system VapC family toxin [Angustibacter sp.]